MSLSKTTIVNEVANRTVRNSSEITDPMIREVLIDLTLEMDNYAIYATASTIVGKANYSLKSFPELFKNVDVVKVNNKEPLKRIPNWQNYQDLIAEQTSADYDEPEFFIVYDDVLYLFPWPDAIYTIHLWGTKVEVNDTDIDAPDYFEPAIIEGLCNLLYSSKGLGHLPKAQDHLAKYQSFKAALAGLGQKKVSAGHVQPDII